MTHKESQYLKAQEAFVAITGLKEGSKIKIIAQADDNQFGWGASWNPRMTRYINNGEEYTVNLVNGVYGIRLYVDNDYWSFPFFCVQVVEDKVVTIPLDSGDYDAVVQLDGSVKVGCQTISAKTLDEIHKASKEKRA